MIVVIGSVVGRAAAMGELIRLCTEHVHRSRLEPGCVSHDVHADLETDRKLVFVEVWSDRDALAAHFAVPASAEFIRSVRRLAEEAPIMTIYEAKPVQI